MRAHASLATALLLAACDDPAPVERQYLRDVLVPPTSDSDLCYQYCYAVDPCYGEGGDMEWCLPQCGTFTGDCRVLADEYYACVLEWSEDYCQGFDPCAELYADAQRCSYQTTSCDEGTATSCGCQGRVLDYDIGAECEAVTGQSGETAVQCACYTDKLVSTCQQATLDCALETTCCRDALDPFYEEEPQD